MNRVSIHGLAHPFGAQHHPTLARSQAPALHPPAPVCCGRLHTEREAARRGGVLTPARTRPWASIANTEHRTQRALAVAATERHATAIVCVSREGAP
jgi:hypothetical protein